MERIIEERISKRREVINKVLEYSKRLPLSKSTVILIGSYAHGDFNLWSDIDVLVVVDDSLDPSEVRRSLSDTIFDILLEKEELISVVAVPESFFVSYNSPFLSNVKDEGVIA